MKDLSVTCGRSGALLSFAVLALLALPLSLSAKDLNCEGCSSEAMHARAKEMGLGQHRIYSIDPPLLYAYRVYCADTSVKAPTATQSPTGASTGFSTTQGPCPSGNAPVLEQQEPDALTVDAFDKAIVFYSSVNPQPKKSLVVGGQSRVEFVAGDGAGAFADSVASVLGDYSQRVGLVDHLMQDKPIFMRSPLDSSTVEVTFKDNSSIQLVYTADTRLLWPVSGTARGPDGQVLIETNAQRFAGQYVFNSEAAMDTYVAYLAGMGVLVSGTGHGGYRCRWNPAENSLACTRFDS